MVQSSKIYYCIFFSIGLTAILFILSLVFPQQNAFISFVSIFFLIVILVINGLALFLLKKYAHNHQPTAEQQKPEKEVLLAQPISTALQEKLKYEALLASIGEGLIVTDKSGNIITFNKAAVSILGWTEQEALGKSLKEIINIKYKKEEHKSSLYLVRKDKTEFPTAITDTSYIQGTKILGTITLFRDITLEQNIDKMKNEFISLASHQLRTPLAAIKWYTKMLHDGDAGKLLSEQIKYVDNIYVSIERMISLVNSLLNISRIESGRINVEPKPTDIKKLIEEIIQEVKIRFAAKKQQFNIIVHEAIPSITLDPQLIRQVYINLLTNAAKYTPERGDISVVVSIKDNELISEVSDNGYGIPEKEQEKIFDKFYRGENIKDKENDGTGLGLYLVKSIVELSEGKIWYKSSEGKGTTFWLSLPIAGPPPKKGVLTLDA